MKALVPAGFMPSTSKSGKTEIVICSGHGQVTHIVDIDQSPFPVEQSDDHEGKAHSSCPYASISAQEITDIEPARLFVQAKKEAEFNEHIRSLPYGTITKPWLSRGPPKLS